MVLVALFAIPDSLVIWFAARGWIPCPPGEAGKYTGRALLFVNICFGLLLLQVLSGTWLRSLMSRKEVRSTPVADFTHTLPRESARLVCFGILACLWFAGICVALRVARPRLWISPPLLLLTLLIPPFGLNWLYGRVRRHALRRHRSPKAVSAGAPAVNHRSPPKSMPTITALDSSLVASILVLLFLSYVLPRQNVWLSIPFLQIVVLLLQTLCLLAAHWSQRRA
jgi:hypothetical protein